MISILDILTQFWPFSSSTTIGVENTPYKSLARQFSSSTSNARQLSSPTSDARQFNTPQSESRQLTMD